MKGLVIRQPWIGMILRGEKTWEMRSRPCRHRGPVALIEKGSGTVVALANIVDDIGPLSEIDLRSSVNKHGIPVADIPDAVRDGWVCPWVLADVACLSRPVPYNHTSGGSWVNLTKEEEAAVLSARQSSARATAGPLAEREGPTQSSAELGVTYQRHRPLPLTLNTTSGPAPATQMHKRPGFGAKSVRSITEADVSKSFERRGNKVLIEVAWDEADWERLRTDSRFEWTAMIGVLAVAVAMFCQLAFIVHFALGMVSSSISALTAFKWLIPFFVATIIVLITGQAHLLDDHSSRR